MKNFELQELQANELRQKELRKQSTVSSTSCVYPFGCIWKQCSMLYKTLLKCMKCSKN